MPRYVLTQLTAGMLRTLGDGLDIIDVGIVLLNRDLRAVYINQKFWEIWRTDPDRFPPGPTFRDLLDYATVRELFDLPETELPAYVAQQEAQVRAGSIPLTRIGLADYRYVLFRCVAAGDGGRLLTYIDISTEIQQAASDATERASAELRFNTETLESQAAYLASLAEATEENAQKAEAARVLLEKEIAERRQLEVKLREMATTDGLTGALNRSEFLASAQYLLGLGTKMAVLMIDVDHFKMINDSYGHAGGDCALRQLVATLRIGIRRVDLLGRLGGEEFAVALPGTPPDVAERVAERLRAKIADTPVCFGHRLISMTVSMGLAAQLETDESIERILARADDALYRAKALGRNRVVVDSDAEAA